MKKIDQTTFGFPGGNCFSACVASILEISLSRVPYFMGETEKDGAEWFGKFETWLQDFCMYPICTRLEDGGWRPRGLHIMSGRSPRGKKEDDYHSVVALSTEIIFDPHPSRDGILSNFDTIVLVALDPSMMTRGQW